MALSCPPDILMKEQPRPNSEAGEAAWRNVRLRRVLVVSTPVSMPLATPGSVSAATIAKVTRRLLPFLLLMYVLAFLDRANVGFAKKAYQLDTNISDAAFAFGASIFFLGYAVLEVPSNLIMHKVGARAWMCRIMVSWGLLSAAMMYAHSEVTFYILRFLLGVAEAGFFPGVILYLTYWYPSFARAKATGLFYFGAPLAFSWRPAVGSVARDERRGRPHGLAMDVPGRRLAGVDRRRLGLLVPRQQAE
jgi:hypothetical protein